MKILTITLDPDESAVLRFALDYISDYEALWRARPLPGGKTPAEFLDAVARILNKLPKE
jgi:hypothetical protein